MSDDGHATLADHKDRRVNETSPAVAQGGLARGILQRGHEWKMRVLFCLLYALLSFIDAFLYILGDMVMINTQIPNSILFIKSVLVLPVTLFFVAAVQKGLGLLGQPRMFELTLVVLAVFFLSFGFVVWPHSSSLQMDFFWSRDMFSDGKMKTRRLDFLFPVALVVNEWVSTVLYIVAELWGSLILSFMFFSRVTHQCTEDQLKRFIPVLCLISGFVLLFSGLTTKRLNKYRDMASYSRREAMFSGVFLVTSILTLLAAATSLFIDKTIPAGGPTRTGNSIERRGGLKMGFLESFRTIRRSRLLMALTNTIIAYAASSNILEATYRGGIVLGAEVLSLSKDSYMNRLNSLAQIIVSIFLIVIFFRPATHVIEKRGWLAVAIVAPAVTIVSLLLFFPMVMLNNTALSGDGPAFLRTLGGRLVGRYVLENYIGMAATSVMRVSKYCFFDIAKEVVSIRIDAEHRQLFRGIYDGVGMNIGKAIGSVYCAFSAVLFDSRDVRNAAAVSAVFVGVLCLLWIWSVSYLNRKYKESTEQNKFIDIDLVKS